MKKPFNRPLRAIGCAAACAAIIMAIPALARATEDKPRVAVLWVDAGPGVAAGDAALMANRLSSELAASGLYEVVPRHRVTARLAEADFDRASFDIVDATRHAAAHAGVDFALVGRASRTAGVVRLQAAWWRTEDERVVRTNEKSIRGTMGHAMLMGPRPLLEDLLGFSWSERTSAPRVAQASAPGPRPETARPATGGGATTAGHAAWTTWRPRMPHALDRDWVAPNSFIARHIQFGTRGLHVELLDDSDPSFLGTITKLEPLQDQMPERFFLDIRVYENWHIELVPWETLRARTRTFGGKSDGNLQLHGPVLTVNRHFRLRDDWTGYVGAGAAFYGGSFSETAHWGLGYGTPEEWIAAGRPTEPLDGRTRTMQIDGEISPVLQAGAIWRFANHWAVDAQLRYVSSTADAVFRSRVNGVRQPAYDGEFTMDHIGLLLGIRYIPGT